MATWHDTSIRVGNLLKTMTGQCEPLPVESLAGMRKNDLIETFCINNMKLKVSNWRPSVPGSASNIKCFSNVAFTLIHLRLYQVSLKIWEVFLMILISLYLFILF